MTTTRFQKPADSMNARPLIVLLGARALYIGSGLQLSPHRNAVATWAMGLDHAFTLTMFAGTASTTVQARQALIPAGARHHLQTQGRMLFLYVDATSGDLAALTAPSLPTVEALAPMAEAIASAVGSATALRHCREFLHAIGVHDAETRLTAIHATLGAVIARPQDFPTLAHAARHAGLSPSRFQHSLREATGVAFRRYRQLRRMAQVLRCLAAGSNLTDAALEAGFASSSHLSTTFRDLFGMAPSRLVAANVRFLKESEPDSG